MSHKADMDRQRLIDYVHGTLPPQEREAVEQALRADPEIKTQIQEIRQAHDQLRQLVSSEINATSVPSTMRYQAISSQVRNRKRKIRSPFLRLGSSLVAVISVLALGFALWYSLPDRDTGNEAVQPSNIPTIIATPTSALEAPALPTVIPTVDPDATPTEDINTIPERTPQPESFYSPRGLNHQSVTDSIYSEQLS